MKFISFFINEISPNNVQNTPLNNAIEKQNIDIVKLLLSNSKIDVNIPSV